MRDKIDPGDTVTYTTFNCEALVLSLCDANNHEKTSDIRLTNGMRILTVSHKLLTLISKAKKGA